MNILIFRTIGDDVRIERLIQRYGDAGYNIYLVIPQAVSERYKGIKRINLLVTALDYISYIQIKKEKIIPDVSFDKVLVISSQKNNYWSFGEVYALLTEIRYKSLVWIGSNEKAVVINNTLWHRIVQKSEYILKHFWFEFSRIESDCISFICRLRW